MIETIKRYCLNLATLGRVGHWPSGSLIASLLAIALLAAGRVVYLVHPGTMYTLLAIVIVLFLAAMQLGIGARTDDSPRIVLDRTLGTMLAFAGISFSLDYWRLIIFGLILFHIFNLLLSYVRFAYVETLEKLPGVLGLVASELLAGILVNIILRLGIVVLY